MAERMRRITAAALAVLTISAFCACSGGTGVSEKVNATAAESDQAAETEETEAQDMRSSAKDDLPELDFEGGELRVLARGGDEDVKIEFFADGETGDIVNDAVYKRNLSVEERLNLQLKLTMTDSSRHGNDKVMVRSMVLAGSDEYDVIANHMYYFMSLVLEGCFYNLNELPYIEPSQPWWNQSYNTLTGIDGKIFAAAGELSLTMISGSYCVFFNSDLFSQAYPDVSVYDTVIDGEWTIDKLHDWCKGLYRDLNGDSVNDQDDFYGLYVRKEQTLAGDAFTGGVHLTAVEQESDGSYKFVLGNERTVEFTEKMRSLIYDPTSTCRGSYNDDTVMQTMLNGTTIFTPWMLGGINYLRDMDDNYGIVPMPKLDEEQESYSSYAHDGFSIFVIPVTCTDPDRSAAFLEAMCAETYRSVMPAYFETAIKVKYSRDELTGQMLDLISSGVYLDISYVFGDKLGAVVGIFRDMFVNEKKCETIMSTITAREERVNRLLAELTETYDQL